MGNIVDPENYCEGRNSSPRFWIPSCAQEPAMKKVFHTVNHRGARTLVSMITIKLHLYLQFYQSELSYGRGKQSDKEECQK